MHLKSDYQQNILISDSKLPLIADFGVSYIMSASMATMCGTGRISPKGTARWTAFELFDINQTTTIPTEKSDVWAFGMVIYVRNCFRHCQLGLTVFHYQFSGAFDQKTSVL